MANVAHGVAMELPSAAGGSRRCTEVHILFSEAADNFKAYGVVRVIGTSRRSCRVWSRPQDMKWVLPSFRT